MLYNHYLDGTIVTVFFDDPGNDLPVTSGFRRIRAPIGGFELIPDGPNKCSVRQITELGLQGYSSLIQATILRETAQGLVKLKNTIPEWVKNRNN
jgi:hypothetical protein